MAEAMQGCTKPRGGGKAAAGGPAATRRLRAGRLITAMEFGRAPAVGADAVGGPDNGTGRLRAPLATLAAAGAWASMWGKKGGGGGGCTALVDGAKPPDGATS
mmetsp:Transcript_30950/g.81375  ORF Transcript_30950/g.81375 Transcript_30950/m.81375 type:complete len:103 (-) Transcript_30950:130-438(-)